MIDFRFDVLKRRGWLFVELRSASSVNFEVCLRLLNLPLDAKLSAPMLLSLENIAEFFFSTTLAALLIVWKAVDLSGVRILTKWW